MDGAQSTRSSGHEEILQPKKSLIILKMKKHKEQSIGPNQYIHFLLVMESVCNSSWV